MKALDFRDLSQITGTAIGTLPISRA